MVKVKLKKEAIDNYLAKKNLSQNWLALNLGISSAYMSQLLSEKRMVSPQMRQKILDHFRGMTFDDLFEIRD